MKHQPIIVFSILLIVAFGFLNNLLASTSKPPLSKDLSETLGFVLGQHFILERIKKEYPELSLNAKKAELEFKSSFSLAEENIVNELKSIFKENFQKFYNQINDDLLPTLGNQIFTRESALNFINQVSSRAKGDMPSPVMETLLTYQFIKNPFFEFDRGFRQRFRSENHPKAKGADIQIDYPKSWSRREGNRPNVIQFFQSENGRGVASVIIMTKDIIEETDGELSSQEIQNLKTLKGSNELASEIFTNEGLLQIAKEMGLSNISKIQTKKLVIDNWPGAVINFIGEQHRLDLTLKIHTQMYLCIYKNYMIFLQCMVGKMPNQSENDFQSNINKYDSLFYMIANSLIIQNQY